MMETLLLESFTQSLPDKFDFYELGQVLSDSEALDATTFEDLAAELLELESRAFRIFSMEDSEKDDFIGLVFFPKFPLGATESEEDYASTYEEFGNLAFSQCLNAHPGLWVSPPIRTNARDAVRAARALEGLYIRRYLHVHEGRVRPIWLMFGLNPSAKRGSREKPRPGIGEIDA